MADVTPRQACVSAAVDEVLADIPPRQLVERAAEAAATAARAEIVAWLRAEALAVRRSGAVTGPEWCDALRLAADRIEGGAPQRWAAERDVTRVRQATHPASAPDATNPAR